MGRRGKIISQNKAFIRNLSPRAKKYVVVSGMISLLIVSVIINRFISTSSTNRDSSALPTSKLPIITPQPTPKLVVPDSDKIEVSETRVNNFYKDAKVINAEGDLRLQSADKSYSIIYFPKSEQFNISIVKAPFQEIRMTAEEDFVNKMGVDKDELCNLDVVVTTPRFANPEEAGTVYKLSFCQ